MGNIVAMGHDAANEDKRSKKLTSQNQQDGPDVNPNLACAPSHNAQDLSLFTTLARQKSHELQLPDSVLTADFLRTFLQGLGSEVAPVAAVLGATLAQDVLNVLQKKEQPVQNLVCLEGEVFAWVLFRVL